MNKKNSGFSNKLLVAGFAVMLLCGSSVGAKEQAQPDQAPALLPPLPAPAPSQGSSEFTPQGMPKDDPNFRKHIVPLGIDEFRVPTPTQEVTPPKGEIVSVSRVVLPDRGPLNCTAVVVRVKNGGSDPLIIDGNRATTVVAGQTKTSLSEEQAIKIAGGQFTKEQIATLAVVGVMTLGFAEPILQDEFSTSKKDLTKSYGRDERRRKLEGRRLARRIVLPGETTEGVIIFSGTDTNINRVVLPMLTYPEGNDSGVLNLEAKIVSGA